MTTLRFCGQCDGSISKVQKIFFTRDNRALCTPCHEEFVSEKAKKAKEHLRREATRVPKDRTVQINVAIGVAIIVVIGGFVALMMIR